MSRPIGEPSEATAVLAMLEAMIADKRRDLKRLEELHQAMLARQENPVGNELASGTNGTESTEAKPTKKGNGKGGIAVFREQIAVIIEQQGPKGITELEPLVNLSAPTVALAVKDCPWFTRQQQGAKRLVLLTDLGRTRHDKNGHPTTEPIPGDDAT